jgi:hypothetical protein
MSIDINHTNDRITSSLGTTSTDTNFSLLAQKELRLTDSDSSNYLAFKSPATVAADRTYTLPATIGNVGDVLKIASGATASAATLEWSAAAGGAGVSDGDKGDITVSSSGATWTIDNTAVTYAKIQNVTTSRILGRSTAGVGSVEEITIGSGLSLSGGTLSAIGGGSGISSSRAIALTLIFS